MDLKNILIFCQLKIWIKPLFSGTLITQGFDETIWSLEVYYICHLICQCRKPGDPLLLSTQSNLCALIVIKTLKAAFITASDTYRKHRLCHG